MATPRYTTISAIAPILSAARYLAVMPSPASSSAAVAEPFAPVPFVPAASSPPASMVPTAESPDAPAAAVAPDPTRTCSPWSSRASRSASTAAVRRT